MGTNTAMMENVVARTARPISLVPSRAAFMWSWSFSRWRTMFSRTTMASSMSRPMASDNAIRVMTFKVMPSQFMAINDEMTDIGNVRPVMTVDRQEFKNRKTMKIVNIAPMMMVSWTSATESRIITELSRTNSRYT